MGQMTSQERIRLVLAHKEADSVPIHDSIWGATLTRWRSEGMPDILSPEEFFGFEMVYLGADLSPMFPVRILERNEEYIIETTSDGEVQRNHRDRRTTPEVIDSPVKTREDWEKIKKRLQPSQTRVDWVSMRTRYHRSRSEGKFIVFSAISGYDRMQRFMRSEQLLLTLAMDPDWIREMAETNADLVIETAKMVLDEGFQFDGVFMFNDMGYRKGLLFSPKTYRQVFKPSEKRIWDFFHSRDMKVLLHCCGNINELIPDLIEIGLDCLQPLEVKSEMDLVQLKREYGHDLAFMGGIDVRAMYDPDPTAIEREIASKIPVAMKGGGYIYHSDHSVPLNVSYPQYQRVMELVQRYGTY